MNTAGAAVAIGRPVPAPLRRHQLVRLSAAGWSHVRAGAWAGGARDCIAHWATNDLPLVVARQRAPLDGRSLDLGLPAPACWGRQRLSLRVDVDALQSKAEFPPAPQITPLLPPAARAGWCALVDTIAALGVPARVYGSFGWQRITGLACVRDGSDLDLLLPVGDAATADAVAARLSRAERLPHSAMPPLDGELAWPDGSAVAWREWRDWRADAAAGVDAAILVKRIDGVALLSGTGWLDQAAQPGMDVGRTMWPVTCPC